MPKIDIDNYIEQSGMRKARFGGYEPDDVRQAMLDLCSDYEQRLNTAAQQVRGAQQEAEALRRGDLGAFLALVNESGASSWQYLQNVAAADPRHQALALTLALCRRALAGQGAVRVHGGGFAGTALAFVPETLCPQFQRQVEQALGVDRCRFLSVRNPLAGNGEYC